MNKFETTKLATMLNIEFGQYLAGNLLTSPQELTSYDVIFNNIKERGGRELKEIYGLSDEAVGNIMASASTEVLVKTTLAQVATIEWFGRQTASSEEEMEEATKVFSQWSIETGVNIGATWFSNLYMAGLISDIVYFKGMQFGWLSREVLLDSMTTLKQPTVASYIAKAKEMGLSQEIQEAVPHFASVMASYTV